jgi:hypothetical protein
MGVVTAQHYISFRWRVILQIRRSRDMLGVCSSSRFSRNRAPKTFGKSRAEIAKTADFRIARTDS